MSHIGELIKGWRQSRGLSQMDLGFEANISSKHISFLETGRSQPSREMIIKISNSLDIPLSERNVLLNAAGFSEAYSRMDINQPEMQPVRNALHILLTNHNPYPAVVFDWDWNIVMANEAQLKLSERFLALQPNFPITCNILEMLFDPNGYRPFIDNWAEVVSIILQRLHKEKVMYQDRHSNLLARLMQYPDIPASWRSYDCQAKSQPMVNLSITLGAQKLTLFSTLASFGTPIDITMQELTIEQYFPADAETQAFLDNL